MTLRILCSGDIHLGRLPTRVPWDSLSDENLRHSLKQDAALERLVRHAIEQDVHAVMLSGDIIDKSNSYFEGVAALESPIRKLVEAQIPVFAVAGNHDWNILAELADNIPGFTLLGRSGEWESQDLVHDGVRIARLHGRSFVQNYQQGDPTLDLNIPDHEVPNLVLLHADVGAAPDTPYAPVSLQRLKQFSGCTWILGHIHKPQQLHDDPLIIYPGSLVPLDPGETGSHGASLISLSPGEPPQHHHLPLSAIRYENVDIDVGNSSESPLFDPIVHSFLKGWIDKNHQDLQFTERVILRIRLQGRVVSLSDVERYRTELSERNDISVGRITFSIDTIRNQCEPELSLEELSRSHTPPGLLAQKILLLKSKQPVEDYNALIGEATGTIHSQIERSHGSAIGLDPSQDEETVRTLLLESSFLLLDAFLEQGTDR